METHASNRCIPSKPSNLPNLFRTRVRFIAANLCPPLSEFPFFLSYSNGGRPARGMPLAPGGGNGAASTSVVPDPVPPAAEPAGARDWEGETYPRPSIVNREGRFDKNDVIYQGRTLFSHTKRRSIVTSFPWV